MTSLDNDPIAGHRPKDNEGRQLSPVARNALAALIGVVVVLNVVILMNRLGPPTPPDTNAKLRQAGGPIPVYRTREGDTHIHLLQKGTTIPLGDVDRLEGPRYPVHVAVDKDTVVEGFIDAKDLEPGELDRVKRVLQTSR
jgi:hypothetical protein